MQVREQLLGVRSLPILVPKDQPQAIRPAQQTPLPTEPSCQSVLGRKNNKRTQEMCFSLNKQMDESDKVTQSSTLDLSLSSPMGTASAQMAHAPLGFVHLSRLISTIHPTPALEHPGRAEVSLRPWSLPPTKVIRLARPNLQDASSTLVFKNL